MFGHKPTYGLITMRNHSLPGTVTAADISALGPLARSAQDLETALDIMAGPDPDDGGYMKVALPKCEKTSLKQFRVAVKLTDPASDVDVEYADQLQALVDKLAKAGAKVKEAAPDIDTGATSRALHPSAARRDFGAHAGRRHRRLEERAGDANRTNYLAQRSRWRNDGRIAAGCSSTTSVTRCA